MYRNTFTGSEINNAEGGGGTDFGRAAKLCFTNSFL